MKQISNILLVIDDDYVDQALIEEVESIARDNRSHVTIFSVMEPGAGNPVKDEAAFSLQIQERDERAMQLESLSAALSEKGLDVTIEHRTGKLYLEVIRKTLEKKYDLVMKPAKKEIGIKQFLIGGTDIQLMSLCPVPVWIFQPTVNRALKKIAVAVDLLPNDVERTDLAVSILNWGKYMAALVGAELHVINVWNIYREASLHSISAASDFVDKLRKGKERLHQRLLSDALLKVDIESDKVHKHLKKGDTIQLISDLVDELDVDLLMMGTVGRTGVPGFLIGNTADSVLRRVSCSVLAIKPEKFSTPVKSTSIQHSHRHTVNS